MIILSLLTLLLWVYNLIIIFINKLVMNHYCSMLIISDCSGSRYYMNLTISIKVWVLDQTCSFCLVVSSINYHACHACLIIKVNSFFTDYLWLYMIRHYHKDLFDHGQISSLNLLNLTILAYLMEYPYD